MTTLRILATVLVLASAASAEAPWFERVLVTNDDGIDDPRLVALARAFAEVSDVVVVAPLENRSGSAGYVSVFGRGELTAEPRDLGPGVEAWGVDGFPGDCVMLAFLELMRDDPPDLVVSGVNSGPNLADGWIASGTIGAARLAAHEGVPAIAFSALEAADASMMEAVPRWCVELARGEAVRDLAGGEYLNVNFPDCSADEVRGAAWAEPGARIFHDAFAREDADAEGRTTWTLSWWTDDGEQPDDGDVAMLRSGFVVVVPLLVREFDGRPERRSALPDWR